MGKRAPLRAVWSKREKDFLIHYDKSGADGHFLYSFLNAGIRDVMQIDSFTTTTFAANEQFRAELRKRGFDPDTFQISVKRLKEEG